MSEKNFTVYKSSAGSGKTFTLVKEYLALALADGSFPPQAYKHILAITFTNKAAAEMKERIIETLKSLSKDDYGQLTSKESAYLNELRNHPSLNHPVKIEDDSIRTRAKNILASILHNYSDFAIGTIDSFVQKVVRAFAFDLKIPMNFEIEMDAVKLIANAIDLLLAKVGNDEDLTKALIEFTESKTDDGKSWHIEKDLQSFAKNLLNEEGVEYIDKLKDVSISDFFKIKDTLFAEIKKFENVIEKQGREGLQLIKNANIPHEMFAGGANGIGKYFTYLAEVKKDNLEPTATVQKNIKKDSWYAGKATASDKAAIDSIKNDLQRIVAEATSFVEKNKKEFILYKLISKNIYALAVLNEIEKILVEYKAENNILHISEFNKMISKIVLTEPIPFIYERLGERYKNYLIDEFQDTSVLQFQNLLPLIDNSLAASHFTMLVGDGKQAIYRFRGGDVEQFSSLPKLFSHTDNPFVTEREQSLKRNYKEKNLNKNFRSKKEIIEFNNSFFRCISSKLNAKYQSIYNSLEQEFDAENTVGYVQVTFLNEKKEELREQNRKLTYEYILALQKDNFALSDIVILVRKNSDGSDIANYLSQKGIDVISSDSMLLTNSAEVNFLFSVLNYLTNTSSNIIQTEIMQYLISKKQLPFSSLEDAFVTKNEIGLLGILKNEKIDFNINKLFNMPVYELCEELIRIFQLAKTPDVYIQFFLDEVLTYCTKHNDNLFEFIEYWNEKKINSSLIIPQGTNAVSIMTIHKSKGLEFPAVIMPFANEKIKNGKDNLWINVTNEKLENLPTALIPTNKDLQSTIYSELYEEEQNKSLLDVMNVLYVAQTRAEQRLYIITSNPEKIIDSFSNTSTMFAYYFQKNGQWSENTNIYTYGTETKHQKNTKKETHQIYQLQNFNTNVLRDKIKMKAASQSIWNSELLENKKNYGVMIHTALEKIKHLEDVSSSINSMLLNGLISEEEKEKIEPLLFKIVKHPLLKKHFEKDIEIKNEAEIISHNGELFRPDRVVIKGNSATIIDYKTGEEKSIHKKQILQYADLLEQMGYVVNKKLLVYIENQKILIC